MLKRIKNSINRVISVILAVCVSFTMVQIPSFAANTAKDRQSAMIEYFQNQGADSLSQEMTEADLRLFGIFLSNFYVPYATNIRNDTSVQALVREACAFLMGYDSYLSMSSENKAIVDAFANNLSASFTDAFSGYGALYLTNDVGTAIDTSITDVATLSDLINAYAGDNSFYLCTSDGKPFFSYIKDRVDNTSFRNPCNLAMVLSLFAGDKTVLQNYLNDKLANNNATTSSDKLYVTPFGDIVDSAGVVIIPGCTNPYTFSADGSVVPINNAFCMGSLVDIADYDTNKNLLDYHGAFSMPHPFFSYQAVIGAQNLPLKIFGLYTKAPVNFFDLVDFYSLENGVPFSVTDVETLLIGDCTNVYDVIESGSVDTKYKALALYEYLTLNENTVFDHDGSLSLVVDLDAMTIHDQLSDDSTWVTQLLEYLQGTNKKYEFNTYAFAINLGESLVLAESDISTSMNDDLTTDNIEVAKLFQEIYVIDNNKNAYGSFDYANAERAVLFADAPIDRSNLTSHSEQSSFDLDAFYYAVNNIGNLPTTQYGYNDIFETGYSSSTHIVGFSDIEKLYFMPVDFLPENDAATEYKNGMFLETDMLRYTWCVLRQACDYMIVGTPSHVGVTLRDYAEGTGMLPVASTVNFWAEIFYAYMMTGWNPNLPPVNLEGLNTILKNAAGNAQMSADELNAENQKLANKLMKTSMELLDSNRNSAKGNLIMGFLDSWVLELHRKMLGLNSNNIGVVDNASKRFSGFSSPVTVPGLSELPVTSVILENYRLIYILAIIIAFVASILFVAIHLRTWRQAVASVLLIAICLLLPQTYIDGITTTTNMLIDTMFSDRFTYWAIIQHQQMLQQISDTESSGNENAELLANALVDVTSYYAKSNGVQLRWMAAKKTQTFTELTDEKVEDSTIPGLNTYKWLFGGYLKQESYATEPMATYVFRTYTSLAESAQMNYDALKGRTGAVGGATGVATVEIQPAMTAMADYGVTATDLFYRTAPLSNGDVTKALNKTEADLSSDSGLSIENLNTDDTLAGFLLYSESPFYYFYSALKASAMPNGTEGEFLQNFLSDEMYKSTIEDQTYGALRDFLDFEGLFSNVIPYMEASNKYVIQWTEKYGIEGEVAKEYLNNDTNTDHVLNKVWNMYCPWVDTLMASKSATDEIDVMGTTVTITDAFNAASYRDYRPMIFSEAQRIASGVTEATMTDVERRLLRVQAQTYEDLRYLANYAQFDDEVIITAAAMIATFNFNKEFSDTAIMGEASELYPQGYELKNFSFDAFLRLILLNSTGISVMSTTDIYEVVLDQEGFFVGLLLIIVDCLNVYIVPVCMTIFLIAMFTLCVAFVFLMVVQTPDGVVKLTWSTLILPALQYMLATLFYSAGLALLMGEGLTAYVGSQTTAFVTNSPGVTLIMMLLLAVIVIYCYVRILMKLLSNAVIYVKNTGRVLMDGAKKLGAGISHGWHRVSDSSIGRSVGAGVDIAKEMVQQRNINNSIDNVADSANAEYAEEQNVAANTSSNGTMETAETAETSRVERRATRVADEMDRLAGDDSAIKQLRTEATQRKVSRLADVAQRETDAKTRKITIEGNIKRIKAALKNNELDVDKRKQLETELHDAQKALEIHESQYGADFKTQLAEERKSIEQDYQHDQEIIAEFAQENKDDFKRVTKDTGLLKRTLGYKHAVHKYNKVAQNDSFTVESDIAITDTEEQKSDADTGTYQSAVQKYNDVKRYNMQTKTEDEE